jgi:hypothetical protein
VLPEFAGDMLVHVEIDGIAAEPQPLGNGTSNSEHQWTVTGSVELGYDLEEDKTVTFRAWTELYSGGESAHETPATLTGEEPIMGTEWEFVATHVSGYRGAPYASSDYSATTRLTLEFAEGQDALEPHPMYVVAGGTVNYDYSHIHDQCSSSADPLQFEVTEEMAGVSFLTFDTTVTPVTYSGLIFTNSPEFTVTSTCPDSSSTRSHRRSTSGSRSKPTPSSPCRRSHHGHGQVRGRDELRGPRLQVHPGLDLYDHPGEVTARCPFRGRGVPPCHRRP